MSAQMTVGIGCRSCPVLSSPVQLLSSLVSSRLDVQWSVYFPFSSFVARAASGAVRRAACGLPVQMRGKKKQQFKANEKRRERRGGKDE